MRVIATNIGKAVSVEWNGKMIKTGIFKAPQQKPLFLEKEDVVDDVVVDRKYHGGVDKACYTYSSDHYNFWKERYPTLDWDWGMFGENLTIEGLDESKIKLGSIYSIGEALVQVSQPRIPCFKLGIRFNDSKVVKEFIQASYPGIYLKVLQPGSVKVGDEMLLKEQPCGSSSVLDVHSLFGVNKGNRLLLKTAIKEPFLAESYKKSLLKHLQ